VSAREAIGALRLENLSQRYGDTLALKHATLDVEPGEFITLLGPSGSGKTTTLKIVAGFVQPDTGRVILDGQDLTHVPPHRRDIGMVFQNYALFPHLSVARNLAFPLEMRRLPRPEIARKVEAALRLVELAGFGERRPRELSGGQQQRVALARALVFQPRVLLMDEPLGALDRKLRETMQIEIVNICREVGHTVLYVTHDQEEALAISDRVIVMNVGVIEQIGSPETIYNRPRSRFVADFVGSANIIKGKLSGGGLFTTEGGVALKAFASHTPHGRESEVAIRTAYIDLLARPGDNHVPGTVRQRLFHGDFVQYVIDSALGALIVRRPPVNLLDEGAAVTLSFSPEHCVLLEA
jgi:ABC-type Fe3+/spermidine/putrescine transport system ATPase subunit